MTDESIIPLDTPDYSDLPDLQEDSEDNTDNNSELKNTPPNSIIHNSLLMMDNPDHQHLCALACLLGGQSRRGTEVMLSSIACVGLRPRYEWVSFKIYPTTISHPANAEV